VFQFGRAIAREAMDAEREVALLNATLRSTGFSAGLSAGQINDLANEISRATSIDAGDILQGTTALLRFREVGGETFREVSRLAVDLAVATGTSVPEAFSKVGRAVQDPINGARALRDVGVRLSESQAELATKLKDTGDAAGAQRIIIEELAKSVGGSGAAANTGLTGATNNLRNSWNDLLSAIGQTDTVSRLVPQAFRQLAEEINGLAGIAGDAGTAKRLQEVRKEIDELTAARERYRKSNADTSGIDSALTRLKSDREVLSRRQAAEILARSSPDNRDARDLALATDYDRLKPTRGPEVDLRSGTSRIAALGAQMVLDQLNELKRQSDVIRGEANRTRQELEQEIVRGIAVGPEIAARQQKEFQDLAKKLVAETQIGRERAILGVGGELDSLNEALIRGPAKGGIAADEYEQAYARLQERLNEVRGVQKEFAQDFTKDQTQALRDIEFEVQGWGRNLTEKIVQTFRTGRFEASQFVDSILTDMARLAIQQTITKPIFDAISGALRGFGGNTPGANTPGPNTPGANAANWDGKPFDVRFSGGTPFTLGTPKAGGGDVFPGMIYPINERGLEYFAPSVPGTVIPANGTRGGGGATINMSLTVNVAAGADAATVRAAILDAAAIAESNIAKRFRMGQ